MPGRRPSKRRNWSIWVMIQETVGYGNSKLHPANVELRFSCPIPLAKLISIEVYVVSGDAKGYEDARA